MLTGSARQAQEAHEHAAQMVRKQKIEHQQLDVERKRKAMEAQIAAIRAEFEAQETEILNIIGQEQAQETQLGQGRVDMGLSRKADTKANKRKGDAK